MSLAQLMGAPPSREAGRALRQWARNIQQRIARGDMMIGILSIEDVRNVPKALARAGEFGDYQAWIELASWLADPPVDEPDMEGAEKALRQAIQADVPFATQRLVEHRWRYRRETASEQEREEAYRLLREIVEEDPDDEDSIYLLGLLTCQGFGTAADPTAAAELQHRAAALGSADAQFELYIHYATGLGVEPDDVRAFEAIEKAAEADHPRAMYNMGAFYATGRYVPEDPAKAAEWYQRSWDAGNPRAAATLAVLYATGNGVEQNRDHAEELFDQADYLGVDVAQMRELVGL